ncbi:glycosyltransferase [Lentibacillus salinarum]|uniref:Glycosyltransferase n=1 Tax=Lentibacillus salinarum TaxID=446820 RepID=A0ABW3ZSA5_9BACI
MAKKICMVVAYHPFLDARIFKKEAKSLQKKGYRVTMIVPKKNGHLFDIDGTPFKKQFRSKVFTHEGIKIVTYNAENSRRPLNKVLNDEQMWERQGFHNPLTQLAIQEDADIYHTHEYLSLFAGVGIKRLMKKKKGKDVKLIYDSHELTPDPLHPRNSEEKRKLLKQQLLVMLQDVDYVIAVSESIKAWYQSHMPGLPVEVIYNSPPLNKNQQPKSFHSDRLSVGYEGNIDDRKGSQNKIIHISEICAAKTDFQFKIIGGKQHGSSVVIPNHLRRTITLTGWVDYHTIPQHMQDVDIGWIDLSDVERSLNQDYSLPNKFFSYLNSGVPVVTNKCQEMERFIRQHKCGYVIDKTEPTPQDYADVFLYLHQHRNTLQEMSQNGRKAMEKIYSWEKMEKRLFNIYHWLSVN